MIQYKTFLLVAILTCAVLTGCGPDTNGRQSLSGTVTFGGTPMTSGSISFQPTGEVKSSAAADIVNGAFKISAIQGLLPGEYSVVFTCFEPTGKKIQTTDVDGKPTEVDELVSYIPLDYGQDTTQRVTVVEGKNVFEFSVPRSDRPVESPTSATAPVVH